MGIVADMSMIPARVAATCGLAAASAVLLAGCFGPAPSASPSPSDSAPASAAPAPVDLEFPDRAEGELARVTFLHEGPDGVPTSPSEVLAAPEIGPDYLLDAQCSPLADPVEVGYSVNTADEEQVEVSAGTFTCNGTPIGNTGPIGTDKPVQIVFTTTDGVWQAYARLIPAD